MVSIAYAADRANCNIGLESSLRFRRTRFVPGAFSTISFDSLAQDFEATISWIEEHQVFVAPTRLLRYRTLIREVIDVAERRDLKQAEDRYRVFLNALYEAHELVQIWHGLRNQKFSYFAQRLRDVVSGPEFYVDERATSSSNLARNTAYELLVTSQLSPAGLTIVEELPTDVAFSTSSAKILVECKRPQSERRFERHVREAKGQIVRKFDDPRRSKCRGMIALDVTKLLNAQFNALSTPSPAVLRSSLERAVGDFVRQKMRILDLAVSSGVIAFLIRIALFAECRDTGTLMYCQQWGLVPVSNLGAMDQTIYDELASNLGASSG